MLVVRLVEEDIFPVVTLLSVLLKDAIAADSMLHAELLPKLVANCAQSKVKMAKQRMEVTYSDCRTGQLEA